MNNQIKNYLGLVLIIVLLLIGFTSWRYVSAYERAGEANYHGFTVSGEGIEIAVPNIAEFSFGVTTQGGKDISVLQKENSDKMNKIISFLKGEGIEAKDIKTTNYNIYPRYQHTNCSNLPICPPSEIIGYEISQNVTVKVRDFSRSGEILSGVVENGANNVSSLRFTIDDEDAVKALAREKAIKSAQDKAKSIANAAGFKLGRLISLEESYDYGPRPYVYGMGGDSNESYSMKASPTIEAGSEEVKITVYLRYEIK